MDDVSPIYACADCGKDMPNRFGIYTRATTNDDGTLTIVYVCETCWRKSR